MSLIRFERLSAPVGYVQFTRNPAIGDYQRKTEYMQPKDYANDGSLYCYDKGIGPKEHRTLKWKNIPSADLSAFLTFLSTVAVGAVNNFTFTDFDGTTYTARITNARQHPVRSP